MLVTLWLACTTPEPTAPPQPSWEEQQVREGLETATDPLAVGQLCVHAVQLGLQSERCAVRTISDDPAVRAQIHAALFEVTDGAKRNEHERLTYLDQARARYAPTQRDATLARYDGVTEEMARAALGTLRKEFVVPLDEEVLARASFERLEVVCEAMGVAPPAPGPLDALLKTPGLPEPVRAAEVTDAVFKAADRHSRPVWPTEVESWTRHHSGAAPGRVGVLLGERAQVLGFHPAGSALSAGVHQHDVVTRVGSVDVTAAADPQSAAIDALGGENGSTVDITVDRGGTEHRFTLTRQTLRDPTVSGWKRTAEGVDTEVEPGIGYVRISAFRPHTPLELGAIAPILAEGRALVLDLRGNAGGDLNAGMAVLDMFQRTGPMVKLQGRALPDLEEGWGQASAGDPLEAMRTFVLVDRDTASSAEIVAGGLQQLGAKVVGTRTTGKGSAQVLRNDTRGFAVQFTNAHWALPDGTTLQRGREPGARWGVEPDVPVEITPATRTMLGILQAQREGLKVHPDGTPIAYLGPQLDPEAPAPDGDPYLRAVLELVGR